MELEKQILFVYFYVELSIIWSFLSDDEKTFRYDDNVAMLTVVDFIFSQYWLQ